jgi:hypothetical protein
MWPGQGHDQGFAVAQVLIINTGLPVVVCGMPEAEYVLSAEHTERRFKQRLTRSLPRPGTPGRGPG